MISSNPAPLSGQAGEAEKPLITKIMAFLKDRRFEPGEKLPSERYLAARFGVGRNALREAIAMLSALRVLETKANSGIYLKDTAAESSFEAIVLLSELGTTPSAREVVDMMEVRITLELDAMTRACEHRTEEDIRQLREILRQTDAVLAANGNMVELDQAFHMKLASSSHNVVLVRILHAFYLLSLQRRRVYFENVEAGRAAARQHHMLVDAIEQRNAAAAREIMQKHMGDATRYWSEILLGS
ncbi:transcriptional regulator LldR [Pigmentiphaga soli]|uniref:Transcriptional regulator LldR n=1 Tax=Pigmentiphaga soli TaxID=1007095 RepID=A0ABP8GS69_9BURK